jgi:hypothetical protein
MYKHTPARFKNVQNYCPLSIEFELLPQFSCAIRRSMTRLLGPEVHARRLRTGLVSQGVSIVFALVVACFFGSVFFTHT